MIFMITTYSCENKVVNIIETEQFIEIYSRLIIINEMEINKEYHDRLVDELLTQNNISIADIDSTISYLNGNPTKWVDILEKVRDRLQEIRNEMKITPSQNIEPEKRESILKRKVPLPDADREERIERRREEKLKKKPAFELPEPKKPK